MKKTLLFFFLLIFRVSLAQQAYYNDVDLTKTGLELRDELADKVIRTHVNFLTYTPGIWEADKITDLDPEHPENVLLLYGYEDGTDQDGTNDRSRDKNLNGGNAGEWNREHTYAKSLGTPNLGTEGPGSDAHHLRPSDIQRNANRGNRKFASGSGNSGTAGTNWYPGDEWKGDVARMLMYMYLRYGDRCLPTGVAVGDINEVDPNMVDLLLTWNATDPVSAVEDQRNAYHDSDAQYAQGNRNPFIDEPYLATAIWGGPAAEDRWGTLSVKENEDLQFAVYPNPADTLVKISSREKIKRITVYDMYGQLVERVINKAQINTADYPSGIYFLTIETANLTKLVKLAVH